MSVRSELLLGVQVALAAWFSIVAAEGGLTLEAFGVSVARLAHDWIGFTVLAVALASCLVASVALLDLLRSRQKPNALIVLLAFGTAILAISPFANAPDSFSLNGRPPTIVTYPVFLWLGILFLILVFANAGAQPGATPTRDRG